jgi:hypothetical protein
LLLEELVVQQQVAILYPGVPGELVVVVHALLWVVRATAEGEVQPDHQKVPEEQGGHAMWGGQLPEAVVAALVEKGQITPVYPASILLVVGLVGQQPTIA